MHSDALSENIAIYRPIKDRFSSKSSASPIKIVIDSPTSFMRPQRSYLSCKITHFNADGTPNTTIKNSDIGVMSHFKTLTVRVGGKIAEEYSDYPEFLSQLYTYETAARRKYLSTLEGTGRENAFSTTDGSFTVRHVLQLGLFKPTNGQPIPLCLLPNQAIDLTTTLNTPQQANKNAAADGYFEVTDIRIVSQLVTPSSEYLSSSWAGIKSGRMLEYDYVAATAVLLGLCIVSGMIQNIALQRETNP
ncbi:hypothetical protein DFS34DRAFT_682866 [Phlyctochytrium arcticum]|nr:hypothetical protein DFS34DRAFT_682866 [Phlyctochytrium arcticum]